jgi:DNA-directed RNA polymerase subunit RPC12/RpoP
MTLKECSIHHLPEEPVPVQPRSRCPECGYRTHHLNFTHCLVCGHRVLIEAPEPHWRCSACAGHGPQKEKVP